MLSELAQISASELEKLLLERCLRDYAICELSMNEPLDVQTLFTGALTDMGYDTLANIMDHFSDEYVRATAVRIFDEVQRK